MAARAKGSGGDSGADSGEDSGGKQRQSMQDVEALVAECLPVRSTLDEWARVQQASASGKTWGGAHLGKIALEPLESLEDRVAETFPGRHVLHVQVRKRNQTVLGYGRLELATTPASSPAASTDPMQQELLKRLDGLQRRNEELVAKLEGRNGDPVEQFARMAAVAKNMWGPTEPAVAAAAAGDPWEGAAKMLDSAKSFAERFAGAESVGLLIAKEVAPGLKTLVEATGGHLMQSLAERSAANKKEEPSTAVQTTTTAEATKAEGA